MEQSLTPWPWDGLGTEAEWKMFLTAWSDLLLRDVRVSHWVPDSVKESRWFGMPGATDQEVSSVEARLGLTLPPSYRLFLRVSNGWCGIRTPTRLNALRPAHKITWFVEENREWVDAHLAFFSADEPEQQLSTTLQISDIADNAVLLLNPSKVDVNGEWEGWFFATWAAGINPLPSFMALMDWLYQVDLLEEQHQRMP